MKKVKILALLLAVLLVAGCLPIGVFAATDADGSSAGTDAADMTYQPTAIPEGALPVTTADEFAAMDSEGIYYLANDIKVTAKYGTFKGSFYGNGKTIEITDDTKLLFTQVDGNVNSRSNSFLPIRLASMDA